MKKIIFLVIIILFSAMPMAFASGVGGSVGGEIGVEEFQPMVFQCGDRVLSDDAVQPWRISNGGQNLIERNQQYLFEGERYQVDVLVFDKNKIQDDMVDLILEGEQRCSFTCGANNTCIQNCENFTDKFVNCVPASVTFANCNARIDEENLTYDPDTMQGYTCTIDIPPSELMYGLYWLKVRSISSLTGEEGEYKEIARWFINPIISLSVDGSLDFEDARPGTASYSTVLVENTAEGGVLLDMFITGKDWPSVGTQLGQCQNVNALGVDVPGYVNYLPLGAFRYYAENGAYSTRDDAEIETGYNAGFTRDSDSEGYVNINRQVNAGFEEAMFDDAEILQTNQLIVGGTNIWLGNWLYPNSAGMSVTFRLMLPEPCYGDYESESGGSIFFWGEAV